MKARELVAKLYADIDAVESAIGLMGWDRQVLMPPGGASARTAQLERLTTLRYQLWTSDELSQAVDYLAAEPEDDTDMATVRVLRREIGNQQKLPLELVQEKARLSNDAYETWKVAKAENDFPRLEPFLRGLFDIARSTADFLGYEKHVYDPLIDLYEEGATYEDAARMFRDIKEPVVAMVRHIAEAPEVDDSRLFGDWDQARLRDFAEEAATKIGFDFGRGRLNIAPNAFCMNLSVDDVRMTTRPSDHVKGILSSSLHEMGHALYEQNIPHAFERTPLAGGTSLAVHESQSRLWENIVGRSDGFWSYFFPRLAEMFPVLAPLGASGFARAYRKVKPTFIRVGADELSYNLHILVRFELEVELLTRQIETKDLPEAWNAKYTEYLGITPPTNTLGVLQDVHWSRGSVGYFPTYAMGNLIGGQMWACIRRDLGDVDGQMAAGDFSQILDWLREKVYRQGRLYTARELVTRATGRPMEAADWLEYAAGRYGK